MKKIFLLVLLCVSLGACSNRNAAYEMEPIGVGTDPAELKKSPCACTKIEMKVGLPEWLLTESV